MKKNIIFIIALIFIFSISSFWLGKSTTVTHNDLPKNQLTINPDFFEVKKVQCVYSDNNEFLSSSIRLTNKGKEYVSSELFLEDYKVDIYLIDNTTNEEYVSYVNLEWKINQDLDIYIPIKKGSIVDKELYNKFNSELDKLKSGKECSIMYRVEVSPKSNSENIMRTVGMLSK